MAGEAITIRGTSDGLIIGLGEGSLRLVLDEMTAQLSARASFFLGGRVAVRVGDRPLSVEQIQTIGDTLEQSGLTLWAVEGAHPATCAAVQELGLEISLQPTVSPASATTEQVSREEMAGIVARRTLRSGQAIHHAGHVTLIGDVNPGAEVVAGGDIIIWGKLRGTAHAGAMGDDEAVICALQMAPSQIRIGSHIARSPERGRPPKFAEIASVQGERIVVERWTTGK